MRVLGIDPGLTGGAAILVTGGDLDGYARLWDAIDIPTRGEDAKRRVDVLEFTKWIAAGSADVAFIERAGVMPRQHPHSGFIYGRATGAIEAATILARIPLHVVEPAVWKRAFGLKGGDKESARLALVAAMPSAESFMLRKKDHNRAEAALIAMYGADLIDQGFAWHCVEGGENGRRIVCE